MWELSGLSCRQLNQLGCPLVQAAKKGVEGKAEELEAVEKPAEAEVEPVEAERRERRSLWQRIRRRLLVWLVVGPTREVRLLLYLTFIIAEASSGCAQVAPSNCNCYSLNFTKGL